MKFLLDMNLSPQWVDVLQRHGFDCIHWFDVGGPQATDSEIMGWARRHGRIVLTHDLDFGAVLAATRASGPSVIQLRVQDLLPDALEGVILHVLRTYEGQLEAGSLLVVDPNKARVRILPLST